MAKVYGVSGKRGFTLQTGSDRKWDVQKDRFTARIEAWEEREFADGKKTKRAHVIVFRDENGNVFERNATTAWDRWFGLSLEGKGDKKKAVKVAPVLFVGDVVTITSIEQVEKGRNRFFNFKIEGTRGKDRPKWAQS